MCFKMPKIEIPKVETSARDLLPQTESATPDSPMFGGSDDRLKKGKETLKIDLKQNVVNNATLSKSRGVTGYNVF